jgi:TetR/AcrR family transcriptional regulator, upper aerobic nicotinate degradation pathway regulator
MNDSDRLLPVKRHKDKWPSADGPGKIPAKETISHGRGVGRPPGRTRNVDGPTQADALMAAALELFAERNLASVTIRDIARATGVNTALIYYYFGSKKALFLKSIEYAVEGAFAQFDGIPYDSDEPAQLITSWLDNHLHLYDRIHKLVKVSLDYKGALDKDPAIDRAINSFYDRERELLARCIRAGVERKLFKPVKPEKMAEFISTYLDGAMVRAVIVPDFNLGSAVSDLRAVVWELLGYEAGPGLQSGCDRVTSATLSDR